MYLSTFVINGIRLGYTTDLSLLVIHVGKCPRNASQPSPQQAFIKDTKSLVETSNLVRSYNQFHNILGLPDVLPDFPFTTSEMMDDNYL